MEAVADFERCVALLRGGDPAGATTALLGLRDNPQCVDIARAVLARSTNGDALFHALALFRDGALKSWDARPSNERDAMAAAALDFARGEAARNAPPYVTAAARVLRDALGAWLCGCLCCRRARRRGPER